MIHCICSVVPRSRHIKSWCNTAVIHTVTRTTQIQ